jgi:hypothetical protein
LDRALPVEERASTPQKRGSEAKGVLKRKAERGNSERNKQAWFSVFGLSTFSQSGE